MRGMTTAVLLAAALAATPASAQSGDALTGTWAFQTQMYGDAQFAVAMSGVAIVSRGGAWPLRCAPDCSTN